MDKEVEGDGNPGDGGGADQLGEAEQGGGTVVIGMEESQGLFLEDEEKRVDEFDVFGDVVQLVGVRG
jgi:hypothetical protein